MISEDGVVAVDRQIVSILKMVRSCHIRRSPIGALCCSLWLVGLPMEAFGQSDSAARAIPATEEALAESERKLGPSSQRSLTHRRMLADFYEMQGRFDEAAALMRREVKVLQRDKGEKTLDLTVTFNRLAKIYRTAGRDEEAAEALTRALAIYRAQPAHGRPPSLVMREKPEAIGQVVNVPTKMAPPRPSVPFTNSTHPAPPRALMVNTVPEKVMKPVAPPPLGRRELQLLEQANRLDREAQDLWWQRRVFKVERKYREALRCRESALGSDHPDVGHNLIRLARLYWAMDRHRDASAMHRRAISILERRLPPDDPNLAEARWELAGFLRIRGYYRSAQEFMSKAMATFEKDVKLQANIYRRRAAYAAVLEELGRREEAATLRR